MAFFFLSKGINGGQPNDIPRKNQLTCIQTLIGRPQTYKRKPQEGSATLTENVQTGKTTMDPPMTNLQWSRKVVQESIERRLSR